MEISSRVEILMNDKNLNYRSLGKKIGYSDTQVRNVIIGKSIPKVDFIQNLSRIYPDVRLEWIVTGNGSKYKSEPNIDIHSTSIDDILKLDLNKDISRLVRFLIENNSVLLTDPIYREFIKDNLEAIDLMQKKEETQKKIDKANELMRKKLLSRTDNGEK